MGTGIEVSRIGLISDTHGLLRPEALAFLAGCDWILHGGDIGGPEVLAALGAIAPVMAVRGNNDGESWADQLPPTCVLRVGALVAFGIHDVAQIDRYPVAADANVIAAGHSHKPCIEARAGRLFVNPGSAGPRRFALPVSIAEVWVEPSCLRARIVDLRTPGVLAEAQMQVASTY